MDKNPLQLEAFEILKALKDERVGASDVEDRRMMGALVILMSEKRASVSLINGANSGAEEGVYWVKRLARYGVTEGLINEIDDLLKNIEVPTSFSWSKRSGKFEMMLPIPNKSSFPTWNHVFALMVSRFVNSGLIDRLHTCQLDGCNNYLLGGPRAKWCSDNCGSKHRVRNKRKRDKNRGIAVHGLLL